MKLSTTRKRSSHLALAIALATGSAMFATAAFPSEAHAQRDRDEGEEQQDGGGYSTAFIEAYNPLNAALQVEGVDVTIYKPQLEALVPISNTPDEKFAAGGLIYNSGAKLQDRPTQLTGIELLLESGRVTPADLPRFNFIAYQISNAEQDFAKARTYLRRAIDLNFTTETISAADLQIALAENYFAANEFSEGFTFLKGAIESRKAQGETVEEQWYRRGLTVAYNNDATPQVYDFTTMWIEAYPSPANWRDAVNITRNINDFEFPELLDLLRLSRRTDALQDKNDYSLYIEAADPRRLPKEVKDLIEEGYASDAISRDDIFISDALTTANGRIESDRADLPALEADAGAAGAALRTVTAAGSAFLSYGEYAKAARFYEKALGMPGVNTAEALTRLGIAQIGMGDYAAARETLSKVEGKRAPIAQLWSAYIDTQSVPATGG